MGTTDLKDPMESPLQPLKLTASLHLKMDGWKMILCFWETLCSGAKPLVSGRVHTWRYGWWFRNPAITSWRLVVYPIIYKGFIHPRWLALGFLPSTVQWYPLKFQVWFLSGGGVEKSRLFEMMVFFWPEFNCDTTRENINSLSFCGVARADAVSSPHHVPLVDAEMTKLSHSTMISEVAWDRAIVDPTKFAMYDM